MLNYWQARTLEGAGFLPEEVAEFDRQRHPVSGLPMNFAAIFKSQPFVQMLKSRSWWWDRALTPVSRGGYGYSRVEAIASIRRYYKKKGTNVFQFLKAEYRPPRRLSASEFKSAVTAKTRMGRILGKAYAMPTRRRGYGKLGTAKFKVEGGRVVEVT